MIHKLREGVQKIDQEVIFNILDLLELMEEGLDYIKEKIRFNGQGI